MVFYHGRHFRNLLNMRKKFKIANKIIGDGHPTFLIAEIASNHNRSRATTKKLIEFTHSKPLAKICEENEDLY